MGRKLRKKYKEMRKNELKLKEKIEEILGEEYKNQFFEVFDRFNKNQYTTKKSLENFIEKAYQTIEKNPLKKPDLLSKWSFNLEKVADFLDYNHYKNKNIDDANLFSLLENLKKGLKNMESGEGGETDYSYMKKTKRLLLVASILFILGTFNYNPGFLPNEIKKQEHETKTDLSINDVVTRFLLKHTDKYGKNYIRGYAEKNARNLEEKKTLSYNDFKKEYVKHNLSIVEVYCEKKLNKEAYNVFLNTIRKKYKTNYDRKKQVLKIDAGDLCLEKRIEDIKNKKNARDVYVSGRIFRFENPLESSYVSSKFGFRKDVFGGTAENQFHKGVDLVGALYQEIVAVEDGIVEHVGNDGKGYGRFVVINHGTDVFGNNFKTLYAHGQKIVVKPGEKVKRGDELMIQGKTGRALNDHLHFEIWRNGERINPLNNWSIYKLHL